MRLEFIDRVKENDVLGKSILTDEGQILLKSGVKLTQNYINKLKELNVLYVYVEDDRLDDVNVEDEKLTELKQATIKSMSNIVKSLYGCDDNQFKQSLSAVDDLISYIVEIGDVDKSLYDIKTYDNYTYVHSLDTCIMATFLGMTSGLSEYDLKELGVGAILHDIGKTKIPLSIINKHGKLTEDEFSEIKKHTIYGGEMLRKNISIPDSVISVAEQHHERVDGTGYPYGLVGGQISKFAKIACLCDVYDAVSNDRCYRKKFNPNDAYELILAQSGSSFEPIIVLNFKNTFAIYPLGCCVKLSNGIEGYIIKQNSGFPDRPILRIFDDSSIHNHDDAVIKYSSSFYQIDLLKHPNITIIVMV